MKTDISAASECLSAQKERLGMVLKQWHLDKLKSAKDVPIDEEASVSEAELAADKASGLAVDKIVIAAGWDLVAIEESSMMDGETPSDKGSSTAVWELTNDKKTNMVNHESPFDKGTSTAAGRVVKEVVLDSACCWDA